MEKKNKKSLIFLVLLFVIGITVGGTIAYFSSRDTFSNEFNTGTYVIQSQERFESPDDWTPGTTTDKEVIVTNKGTTPAAVRVKLTESWKDADNNPLSLMDGDNNLAAIINYAFDKDIKWAKSGNWYYYIRPLNQDESTTSLLESITFNPNVSIDATKDCTTDDTTHATTCTTETNGYGGGTYTLVVDIETCQYDKYQEIWNTNVSITPAPAQSNGTLMVHPLGPNNGTTNTTFGHNVSKLNFEEVSIYDTISIPDDAIDSWDVSEEQNGNVMAWYTDKDNNGKYELYIGQEGGVRANPNSKEAFAWFQYTPKMNMKYLDTSQVESMEDMFEFTCYDNSGCTDTFEITGLENWDTSNVTTMANAFRYTGRTVKKWHMSDISSWNTSKVTTMENMFLYAACYSDDFNIGNICNWNVSNVENMGYMFSWAGYNAKRFYIGNLINWDTRKVENMSGMFNRSSNSFYQEFNIGTLNVYADNIYQFLSGASSVNVILNIHNNPTNYSYALSSAATEDGTQITVNYSSTTANIDAIIATKSYNSHVVKGSQLD